MRQAEPAREQQRSCRDQVTVRRYAERERLRALRSLDGLAALGTAWLEDFTTLASRVFEVADASIMMVGATTQWVMSSSIGGTSRTPRALAFCDHTIRGRGLMVVEDARQDPRFADSPLVTGAPHIRFYAGAPLVSAAGYAFGALCVMDAEPRKVSPYQEAMILVLAEQVSAQLELRATALRAVAADAGIGAGSADRPRQHTLDQLIERGETGFLEADAAGVIVDVNPAACRMLGYARSQLVGVSASTLAHHDHPEALDAETGDPPTDRRFFFETTRVLRHATGRKVHVRATVGRTTPSDGGSPRVLALLEDLAGRLAADTGRSVAERALREIVDTTADAFVSLDRTGRVVDWNAAATALFGYDADEAIGRDLALLVIPEQRRGSHDELVARVSAGRDPWAAGESRELPAMRRDGTALVVEPTVWMSSSSTGDRRFHALYRDVGTPAASRTALSEAESELTLSRAHVRAAFESSPTAGAIVESDDTVVEVNPALCRLLGGSPSTLVGRPFASLLDPADRRASLAGLAEVRATGVSLTRVEVRCMTATGGPVWGLLSLVAVGHDTDTGLVMVRMENIQDLKNLQAALAHQSSHDPVSGLPNRALFADHVRGVLAGPRAGPEADTDAAMIVLLVDGLRVVIDRDGYAAADHVLADVAGRLTAVLDDGTHVAHLQPGLFAALVPGGVNEAEGLARRLLEELKATFAASGIAPALRASIGISAAQAATSGTDQVGRFIQDAEEAAHRAALEGADTISFASAAMREAQQSRHRMERLIRDALAHDEINLAYQPIVDLASRRLVGVEALLRVDDDQGCPIPPLELVPVAEESGQIVEIGRRILRAAMAQSARWHTEHGIWLPVAVNVSAVQLGRHDFVPDVVAAITGAGIPPTSLTLELTESVLLESDSVGIEKLGDLRDAGVKLAIDDFGTGYASLTYLRDLPASTIKIDSSFVQGIPRDHDAVSIVAGVIGLARNFGLSCIAEGIETQEQLDYLSDRGVLGQGFLLGRPSRGDVISVLIERDLARPPVVAAPA